MRSLVLVERIVLTIGTLLLVVAAALAFVGRGPELFLFVGAGLIALALFRPRLRGFKLGPGGIDLAIDEVTAVAVQVAEQEEPDLKLLIATIVPFGGAREMMGTDHALQISAVNTGSRPIGVSSLGLSLSDSRWIPFMHPLLSDGNVRLPGILQPQQSAAVWTDRDALRDSLREERVKPVALLANLVDGTIRRQPMPEGWSSLDGEE